MSGPVTGGGPVTGDSGPVTGDSGPVTGGRVRERVWDLVVVGAGPAGTSAALAALHARPGASVLLLDREDFPRDKACGDGIAHHVVDLLATVGVHGLMHDRIPTMRLRLALGDDQVVRRMRQPSWVVPRQVFDARLVDAAVAAGARLRRHRVRGLTLDRDSVVVDGAIRARVVVAADGARSGLRRLLGQRIGQRPGRRVGSDGPTALALRGYAPTPSGHRGEQVIVFGTTRQPSYAWSFDRGDGLANVGYGELLSARRGTPSRSLLMDRLEELLPGATAEGRSWRGHHLPLSGARWEHPAGPVLLAGDAAGLVNPLTGEGIYYAVATGLLAGRAAVGALDHAGPDPGAVYGRAVGHLLGRHLAHTALASRLTSAGPVLGAGLGAAARDQRVFDDLVELGLGRGRITPRVAAGLVSSAARSARQGSLWPHGRPDRGYG